MVTENKNLHITHIKRNLTEHRLYIKVTKMIKVTSGINYDLPRLKHLHNTFEWLYFELNFFLFFCFNQITRQSVTEILLASLMTSLLLVLNNFRQNLLMTKSSFFQWTGFKTKWPNNIHRVSKNRTRLLCLLMLLSVDELMLGQKY